MHGASSHLPSSRDKDEWLRKLEAIGTEVQDPNGGKSCWARFQDPEAQLLDNISEDSLANCSDEMLKYEKQAQSVLLYGVEIRTMTNGASGALQNNLRLNATNLQNY